MDKKNVTVTVKGTQYYEDNGDTNEISFVTDGEFSFDGAEYTLTYRESDTADDGQPIYTNIKTEGGKVSMWRTDTAASDMIFERGKRHHSLLTTDYGNLSLCVVTKSITKRLSENGGSLRLNYGLEVGGHHLSENTISLKIDI